MASGVLNVSKNKNNPNDCPNSTFEKGHGGLSSFSIESVTMADGNAFANDGSFMARFLASQQRERDRRGGDAAGERGAAAAGVVGAAASDERVRASVTKNDGSFLAAFLALQREEDRREGGTKRRQESEPEEKAHAGGEKEKGPAAAGGGGDCASSSARTGGPSSAGEADGGGRRRKKRSRWDAGTAVCPQPADAKKETKPPVDEDEDEALRSVRAKQQKHREELRFLEQRIRGFQQQAVVSAAAAEAKKEAEAALAEERRREYARLAELAERERNYRDTAEQAELGVVRDGTREHRQRAQEMLQTLETAAAATARAEGKHHLGDFLPKDEVRPDRSWRLVHATVAWH